MQRFLRSSIVALASGGFCFMFAIVILMNLGTKLHGNYEYYGAYWWVYCGAGVIGLFIPSILAWILRSLSREG